MRKENHLQRIIFFLCIVFLFFLFYSCLQTSTVRSANEKKLTIVLFDHQPDTGIAKKDNLFLAEHEYGVVVVSEQTSDTGQVQRVVASDVLVTVPWGTFKTTDTTPEITIVAPRFEDYREFVITASKQGYTSAEKLITVIKGELIISTDRGTTQEGESFQVTVKDQDNKVVGGTLVYTQVDGQQGVYEYTNAQGIAYLTAPPVSGNAELVTVLAVKDGYKDSETTLRVQHSSGVIIGADLTSILPVVIAVVVVVVAMIIVRMRKHTVHYDIPLPDEVTPRKKTKPEIFFEEKKEPYFSRNKKNVLVEQSEESLTPEVVIKDEPRIEEIRIQSPAKKKETTYLTKEEDEIKDEIPRQRKPPGDWFEGTDEVRYKIDQLTKDADTKHRESWFEGTNDVRDKIDEAISKKYKKKNK